MIDTFNGEVKKWGNSLIIVVPPINVKFSGIKEGDLLKIQYKKIK